VPGFDPRRLDAHVARLGLDPRARVRSLSRGQRAQVALAVALSSDPEVLVLDDPSMGLDPVVRREFLEAMIEVVQEEGRTVLFTSHVLDDVERVADHVAILDDGVLRVCGPVDAVKDRVVRVHARFAGDAPAGCDLPGVLRSRLRGRSLAVTVCDGPEAATAWARSAGATHVDVERLPLEDLFIDYTTSARAREENTA
jgi:ABC-2 type transport system ATP-binding protein